MRQHRAFGILLLLTVLLLRPPMASATLQASPLEALQLLEEVNRALHAAKERIETGLIPTLSQLLSRLRWDVAFELPPPGVLQSISQAMPEELLRQLEELSVEPRDLPEAQQREDNEVFVLVYQEPPEPRLGLGLNPWSGQLEGALCQTDIVIIFKVCSATPPGVYTKLYEVHKGSGAQRTRVAHLELGITILGEAPEEPQPPQPPGEGEVTLTVRGRNEAGQPVRAPIDHEVLDPQGRVRDRGQDELTDFTLQVPRGWRVRLTAQNTETLRFKGWQGAPPGANPVVTPPLTANAAVTAIYELLIATGDKVTLTIKSGRTDKSPHEIKDVGGFEIQIQGGEMSCNQPITPVICRMTRGAELRVTAPGFAEVCIDPPLCNQKISFPFFAWKEGEPSLPPFAQTLITTPLIKMDRDKTWTAWFRPPEGGASFPPSSVPSRTNMAMEPSPTPLTAAALPMPQEALLMVQGINARLIEALEGFDQALGRPELPEAARGPLNSSREATKGAGEALNELQTLLRAEIEEHSGESVGIEVKERALTLATQARDLLTVAIQKKEKGEAAVRERLMTKIIGFKFHDLNADGKWEFTDTNNNGHWDPGEPGERGLEGWEISLLGSKGQVLQRTKTDEKGRFEFTITEAGTYLVVEEPRAGWVATTSQNVRITVRLFPGETSPIVLLGNTIRNLYACDVILRDTVFQPVQAVFQDNSRDIGIDRNHWSADRVSPPIEWTASLPMVLDKNTLLFGSLESREPLARRQDKIHLRIENHFPQARPVRIRFSLFPQGLQLSEAVQGRLGGPDRPVVSIVLPAAQAPCNESGISPDPGVLDVFLDAPIPDPARRFKFDQEGRHRISVVVLNTDGSAIGDANGFNQVAHVYAEIKETHNLTIGFRPLLFRKSAIGQSAVVKDFMRKIVGRTFSYIQATYPLADRVRKGVNGRMTFIPARFKADSAVDWQAEVDAAANRARKIGEDLFGKGVLARIQEGFASDLDRYVLVTEPGILEVKVLETLPGGGTQRVPYAVGLSWAAVKAKQVIFAAMASLSPESTIAHEIAHTFAEGDLYDCRGGEPCPNPYHNNASALANGYWVNRGEWRKRGKSPDGRALPGFMGSDASEPTWIEQPTYKHLLDDFSDGRKDPEVLAVRGMLSRDGTIELAPWYVMEGFEDVTADDLGRYKLVLLDAQGQTLSTYKFDMDFTLHVHSVGDIAMDRAPFAFRVLWDPRTARIELRGPDEEVLEARDVSANPPQVEVLFPLGGETFTVGQKFTVSWQGTDLDGDERSYTLLYSPDNGAMWLPIDSDLTATQYELDPSFLEPREEYLIRVIVTDGVRTAEAISKPFSVVE